MDFGWIPDYIKLTISISHAVLLDATQGIGTKQVSFMLDHAKHEKWIVVYTSDIPK